MFLNFLWFYLGSTQNPNYVTNKDKEIEPNQKQDASSKDTINRRSRDRNKAQVKNLNHTNKELGITSNSTIQTSQIAPKPTTSQPEINTKVGVIIRSSDIPTPTHSVNNKLG